METKQKPSRSLIRKFSESHQKPCSGSDDDLLFRLILTTGVLVAALDIAWMGGLGSNRFFSPSSSHRPLTSSSAPHLRSEHENSRPATTADAAPNRPGAQNVVRNGHCPQTG